MTHPRSLAFLASLASLATLAFACKSQYEINAQAYCEDRPQDCRGAGGSAGNNTNGGGGSAGDNGSGGGDNGNGGQNGSAGQNGTGGIGGTGGNGGCDVGAIACGEACVNVLGNDAENCGACARSCLGSACKAGVCDTQPVAVGEVAPYALAQSTDALFWVSPARKQDGSLIPRVRSVAKGPQGVAQNLIPNSDVRARSLAFFDNSLFWGTLGNDPSDTAGQRLARGGLTDNVGIPVAGSQRNIQHLVISPQSRVYWTALSEAVVRGAPTTGGALDPQITSQSGVGWVTIDDDEQAYWISTDTKEVRRQLLSASNPTTEFQFVATANAPVSVELGNGRVYWADRVPGAIISAPKDELNNPTTEFFGQGPVEGFAVAGTALVVVTLNDGEQGSKVLKIWRKNESREPLLLGQVAVKDPLTYDKGNPFGAAHVLLDEQFVYFADVGTLLGQSNGVDLSLGDGIIYRVAK